MTLRRLMPRAAYGTVAVLKDDGSVWVAVRTHPQQPCRSYGITAHLTAADQRHSPAAHALYAPALHTWFYDWCMTTGMRCLLYASGLQRFPVHWPAQLAIELLGSGTHRARLNHVSAVHLG
ncbi:hypothetical protein [Streptomyces sp. NBC_01477]|uniref:hypothetical protein n=1 Tax=Streptomyces sp. NBC_01477 TaxID=2976015 RepID=UPI002E34399E|nr:hypothetical protein [Streptomyces sp. NBC_01477]